MRRPALTLVVLGLVMAGSVGLGAPLGAQTAPAVTTASPEGAPGTKVLVSLDGWAPGVVTVVLCGNGGLRGSEDCDLVTGQSVAARTGETAYVELPIVLPRLPCPCVVRASGAATEVTTPFSVVGAPSATPVPREAASADDLEVTARVEVDRGSFSQRLRAVLGGPVRRTVVLRLHNSTSGPLKGVVVTATLGRHAGRGEILPSPPAMDLAPDATQEVRLPVELTAPVHGRYVVSGTAFAAGSEVPFTASAHSTPWGLAVIAGLVVVDLVVAATFAWNRRRGTLGTAARRGMSGAQTLGEHSVIRAGG